MNSRRPTAQQTVLSGTHGRSRRGERGISKTDLQKAKKYGLKQLGKLVGSDQRKMYTYAGITYVTDSTGRKEITSFRSNDVCGKNTGTKFVEPVIVEERTLSSAELLMSKCNNELAAASPHKWNSHTVFVVDMSGSMRRDDVNGARCRSDAVFTAMARDYIGKVRGCCLVR